MRDQNLNLAGLAFYTSRYDPIQFVQEGYPRTIQWVPDDIETPDLMLVIDHKGHYVMKESMGWADCFVKK